MPKTEQNVRMNVPGMILVNAGDESENKGPIYIQDSAIASIVKKIVLGTDGVSRLAGSNILDSLGELVGSRKILDRSITIAHKPNGPISISLSIVVYFGVKIPALVDEITAKVSKATGEMLGLSIQSIKVDVRDLEERPKMNEETTDAEA